jgi:hypothetical protein
MELWYAGPPSAWKKVKYSKQRLQWTLNMNTTDFDSFVGFA